jgi:hypothetical protein
MTCHDDMYLGSYVHTEEDVKTEYKEFCLKKSIYSQFTKVEIYRSIRNGVFPENFNDVMINNLRKYIDVYIPKYACVFHNSNTDGILRVGINDNNEITGIPFIGDLSKHLPLFTTLVKQELVKYIHETCCVRVSLELTTCQIDDNLLDDEHIDILLRQSDQEMSKYNTKYDAYVHKKKRWVQRFFLYKRKLQEVVNDPQIKREFVQFLIKHDQITQYPEVYGYCVICPDDVKLHRGDPTHFIFWLLKFKDERISDLMYTKPKPPMISKWNNIELCLFTQLSLLRKRWVSRLNYYVLDFTFHNTCDRRLTYLDKRKNKWNYIERHHNCNKII